MSSAWSIYVIVLVLITVGGSLWLLAITAKKHGSQEGSTTGHTWDGDLAEYNNPLPRWWLWLFIGSAIFSAIYLVLFPGFGAASGTLGWTSEKQLQAEQQKFDELARQTYARRSEERAAFRSSPRTRKPSIWVATSSPTTARLAMAPTVAARWASRT